MSSPWFPEPMAQPWLDPVHPAGLWYFFRARSSNMASPELPRRSFSCFPYCSRMSSGVGPQGHLRGLRGCTMATVPFDIHSPLRRHQPNPQSRRAKGRRTGWPPQPWSCAFDDPDHQRGLRLAVQRLMLSSMVTLFATFSLVAGAGFSLGQDKACDRESEGVRGMTTIIGFPKLVLQG